MPKFFQNYPWVFQLILIFGGIILGYLVEKIVIGTLKRIAKRTHWEWDDIVVRSIRMMFPIWFGTAGIYAVLQFTKLEKSHIVFINKVLIVLIIASITMLIARITSGFIKLISGRTHGVMKATTLFSRTTSLVIYLIGGFIILQNLNIEITPLITALGVGGLAVALALQDTLGNLFSGIQIMLTKQVRLGDYVKLSSGEEGYVTDIKARNTTIRSFPGDNMVIIPNTSLISSIVTNFNLPQKQMWISIPVGVHYDSDLEYVEKVTLEVAKEILAAVEGSDPKEEPVIRYNEFGDSSVNFNVRLPVREFKEHFLIKHEFIKKLHARYNKEGIVIPFPIRTVYMKNID